MARTAASVPGERSMTRGRTISGIIASARTVSGPSTARENHSNASPRSLTPVIGTSLSAGIVSSRTPRQSAAQPATDPASAIHRRRAEAVADRGASGAVVDAAAAAATVDHPIMGALLRWLGTGPGMLVAALLESCN